jgi:hypothetical protein
MPLDDRTADRQTHSHTVRFCREQRFEYPLDHLRVDSGSGVRHGYDNTSFTVAGATAYAGDVPKAEIHILEAGHFALDEATDQIASLVRDFLERLALRKEHG